MVKNMYLWRIFAFFLAVIGTIISFKAYYTLAVAVNNCGTVITGNFFLSSYRVLQVRAHF